MRLKEVMFKDEASLIIYVTKEEKNNAAIIHKINELKKTYKNLSIFISGDKEMKGVLECLINDKRRGVL